MIIGKNHFAAIPLDFFCAVLFDEVFTSATANVRMIADCRQFHSWHTLWIRVHTGLYIGASNNARLHWIIHPHEREKERVRENQSGYSLFRVFAFVSFSLLRRLLYLLNSFFPCTQRQGSSVFHDFPSIFFPFSFPRVQIVTRREVANEKITSSLTLRKPHVLRRKKYRRICILLEKFCPAKRFDTR